MIVTLINKFINMIDNVDIFIGNSHSLRPIPQCRLRYYDSDSVVNVWEMAVQVWATE